MRPTVLLIEDDENAIELTRRAFDEHGRFEVQAVQKGADALKLLQEQATPPELVILDLGLPDRPGLEVLADIKRDAALHYLPVVVMTVSEKPGDVQAAVNLGASFFVTKPVRYEDFAATVAAVSDFWSNLAQTPSPPRPGL